MLKRYAFLWLLALLGCGSLSAAAQGQLARYRAGKTQLDAGHYALALRELEPLAQPINKFARAADAGYLAAVACARLGQWAEAEQLLNLVRNQYPTYPNLPDVLYLQGQVSFEQGDYDTALRTLGQIPAAHPLVAEREALQAHYLARLRDRPTWQRLLKRYPQSKLLGRLYADFLLTAGPPSEAERQQLERAVSQFGLDRARYAALLGTAPAAPTGRPRRAGAYSIGVLLPFELQDNSWQTQRRLQFVTDFYAGLRLAQDSLARAGRPVQLFAYDTRADTLTLRQVLALPELAGMDMLIGPVYKAGARLLGRFAREHQLICVNPLSQDLDLVQDNPYHYLFSPSAATQGRAAAQFAAATFGTARPALLAYEQGAKDETDFAQAYQAAYEAAGGRVLARRPFQPGTPGSLAAALPAADLATAGHVVVASDERAAGPAAFAALKQAPAGRRPALLAPGTWLDNPGLELGQLGTAYYYHPKYYDPARPGFRRFRQLYLARQRLPPSVFALQGFELGLFFGQALTQYGPAWPAGLTGAGPQPGAIFEGLAYPPGARDNQQVPIVRLNGLEFQLLR